MATVYLAMDLKHEREVAIKVLHPELAATIGPERFDREIRIAAKLQHPNILGLFDSGEADGLLYYVMPFVYGESLRDRLNRDHMLPLDFAVHVALEVADALGYAHSLGIIHRDIKPENIVLDDKGYPRITDLGIARYFRAENSADTSGTPGYMAPEVICRQNHTFAVDYFALGVIAYEFMVGRRPYNGRSRNEIRD